MRKPWYHILYIRSPILKILLGIVGVMGSVVLILAQFAMEEPRMVVQAANWEGRSIEKGADLYANNCTTCHGIDGKGLAGVAPALNSKYFFTQRAADLSLTGTLADYVELTLIAGRPSKVGSQWAQMMPTWSSRVGGPMRDDQIEQLTAFVMNWEADALEQTAEEDPWQCFQGAPTRPVEGSEPEVLGIKTCATDGTATLPGEPVVVATPAAETSGPRSPQVLFATMACVGCHDLSQDQTETNRGPIAPHFGNLHLTAGERVAGLDAATYVYNSIVNPNEFINPGYVAGIMPQNFAEQMSEEEIQGLVAWLLDPNRPQ